MKNKKIRLAQAMMIATIVLIVAFQFYHVMKLYNNEWYDLKKETDVLFRESVYKLQVARFKKDTTFFRRRINTDNLFNTQVINVLRNSKEKKKQQPIKDTTALTTGRIPVEFLRDKIFFENLSGDTSAIDNGRKIRIVTSSNDGDNLTLLSRTFIDTSKKIMRVFKPSPGEHSEMIAIGPGVKVGTQPKERKLVNKTNPQENIRSVDKTMMRIPSLNEDSEIQIFANEHTLNDSIALQTLDSAYRSELGKASIKLPFTLAKSKGNKSLLTPAAEELKTNPASVGLLSPYHYQATFENPFYFLIKKIAPNLLFSLLLVGFTILSFVVLYRNLMSQRRLADIKNDFISNITHELKTPIATVNVAIEAMKSFNVLNDTKRTQEYLDISASELQRLSLLVDKVLKLSMFEKKEIELKKEWLDLDQLVREVMNSMRFQFEKCKAVTAINLSGERFDIKADRLHITSVIYNLFDNALKYSKENPVISIDLISHTQYIELKIKDNGIGIEEQFRSKIFEQFFRVPSGDRHNIKGYGLGLSYVNHIVKIHHGLIEVESETGKGSTFTVKLPYDESSPIHFDKNRSIKKDFFNRNNKNV